MSEYNKVSIIIPAYNERTTIQTVLDQILAADVLGLEKEIIIVDDASTDGMTQVVRSFNFPNVKVFVHEINQGKGAALKTGLTQASGDIVVIQDADLEYDPNEIQKVLRPFMESDAQVVYGSRYLNPSQGLGVWHTIFNKGFTGLGNIFIRRQITDLMTCYKAFNIRSVHTVLQKLESKRFGFEPEVTLRLARAGFQIIEVPISYKPRSKNEGKHMNFKGELESLWTLIKYSIIIK